MSLFFSLKKLEIFGENHALASPVPDLFKMNVTPTEEELASVLEALKKAKEKKATLEHRITLSNSENPMSFTSIRRAKRAQRELQAIDDFISTHEARIAPSGVTRLPPELLSIIFKLAVPQKASEDGDLTLSQATLAIRTAVALSHVCGMWRDLAVSTPQLWQTTPVVRLSQSRWMRGGCLQLLKGVLLRGKDLPLIVLIDAHDYDILPEPPARKHPAIKILVEHSERWQSLIVAMSEPLLVMPQLAPIKGRISSLHTLHISVTTRYKTILPTTPEYNAFEVAPRLRVLSLYNVAFNLTLPPSLSLRDLAIKQPEATIAILRNLPLLSLNSSTIVCLNLQFVMGSANFPLPFILFPNLKSMKVNFRDSFSGRFMIRVTGGSFLQELELRTAMEEDLSVSARAFILRSKPEKLVSFTLVQAVVPRELFPLLIGNRHLVHLDVSLPDTTCLAALLARTSDGYGSFVPNLSNCIFRTIEVIPTDTIRLLQTLAALRHESSTQAGGPQDSSIIRQGLRNLSIHHPHSDRTLQHATCCALNGWKAPLNLSPEVEEATARLKEKATRTGSSGIFKRNVKKFTKAESREMESDLRCIYEYDGLTTVSHLMFTDLPHTISLIKVESSAFDYKDLAEQILTKWDPILRRAYKAGPWRMSSLGWVHYGSSSTVQGTSTFSRL
ncbi:hypothetical protein CPC08DRAFT_234989 [Agrocybe pediades]|nr:hypothetical protein CPC08DRAFT_234989 [Agrocybe pediades]